MTNWIDKGRCTETSKWVKVVAYIKRVADGEVSYYETNEILEDGKEYPNTFSWENGNFSCDCNRELFFNHGVDVDTLCSDGKYLVNLGNPATGEIYYREWE